jgi:ADP-heptose:LPS heptosyltransferase
MLALARFVAGNDVAADFDLELTAAERAHGRTLARDFAGATDEPVIVALAAAHDVRAWPAARAIELVRGLSARGRATLVLSGPAESEIGARVERELASAPRVRHWVGQRGLRELASTFTAFAELGGRFVGCDSGPLHLAWATGLRVVCLAGPQDPARTGPWPLGVGSPHAALFARERPSCAPCLSRRCVRPDGNVCMSALSSADVLAALERPA